jgi:hypothetical protein
MDDNAVYRPLLVENRVVLVENRVVYPIDERDSVLELSDMPKPRGGAPTPFMIADDSILLLSYFVSEAPADAGQKPTAAILQFDLPLMHLFGPPNDEAIRGHPLWHRGLESYGTYRVDQSSLLRRLAAMNYAHPRNDPAAFDKFHHYVVTFEDSTFECIAQSYTVSIEEVPSEEERYRRMVDTVRARDARWRSELVGPPDQPLLTARLRRWGNALNPWSR